MAKQIIRLSEKQLRNIVKESIQNVINEVTPNTQFFSSYDEFLNFIENTDGTIEYLYLSKEKTGLNVDIYVDDCSSYKRHKHPLWLYFCDGYSHDEKLIPIVISNNPTIPIDNCEINLSSIDITSIIQFIKNNAQLLKALANEMIDSISFEEQIIKTSFAFNLAESINMINEMAKIESKYTNLGFDIFIDATPRTTKHKQYRLKYPINKQAEQGNNSNNYTPMSISENPEFLPPANVDNLNSVADMKRKKMMQEFIKAHCVELQQVSDGVKDLNEYKLELSIQNNNIKTPNQTL